MRRRAGVVRAAREAPGGVCLRPEPPLLPSDGDKVPPRPVPVSRPADLSGNLKPDGCIRPRLLLLFFGAGSSCHRVDDVVQRVAVSASTVSISFASRRWRAGAPGGAVRRQATLSRKRSSEMPPTACPDSRGRSPIILRRYVIQLTQISHELQVLLRTPYVHPRFPLNATLA